MRLFLFIWLLSIPIFARTSLVMPTNPVHKTSASSLVSSDWANQSHRTLKHFVLQNGQKKIAKNLARFNNDNGKRCCIAGFSIGLLATIFSALFFALTATYGLGFLIAYISVSLFGLYLSILGLKQARKHEKTRRIRNFAIAGIVLNSIFSVLGILFLIWAIGYTQ